MKTKFDKIYVISLITNKERQEFITYQFNQLNLDFEFIYSIDYYNFENVNFPDVYSNTENNINGTAKDFGCTMGHYQAVMQAYYLGCNNVLIFEDDVCLNKDIHMLEYMLNNLPDDAEFIDYDPRCWNESLQDIIVNDINNSKNDYIKTGVHIPFRGAAMYAIMNRDLMELYLQAQHKCLKMSDDVNYFFENKTIQSYIPRYCLFIDQHTYNKVFINKDNSFDGNYDNMYIRKYNYQIDNFFKPTIFHEYSRD